MVLAKFQHPTTTIDGSERASVKFFKLKTIWFNTGSLCNITCKNCFMESSPKNNALSYLSSTDVINTLNEIESFQRDVIEVGFTGGEPFLNKDFPEMLEATLSRGYQVLVLTNGMKPMWNVKHKIIEMNNKYSGQIIIRVSMDHYTREKHELERGIGSWAPMFRGLKWLSQNKVKTAVAGRTVWGEDEHVCRVGFKNLFESEGICVDALDNNELVLFPEMDENQDVPEISKSCWNILQVDPKTMMCATSRMIVKRKGSINTVVVPCTLLPYDPKFELGKSVFLSQKSVYLNHPHCAKFCVLGGASCSG